MRGFPDRQVPSAPPDYKWIAEDAFVNAALSLVRSRSPKLRSLFQLARGKRIYAIWSTRDPLPFIAYFAGRFIPATVGSVVRVVWLALRGGVPRGSKAGAVLKRRIWLMRRVWKMKRLAHSAGLAVGLMFAAAAIAQGATWNIEMVDQAGTGKFTSLKIDKDGNAHLAYIADDGRDSLKYAFWDHAIKRWFTMTIAEGASFSSLALDSKERPHISWADFGSVPGCRLQYAYWDGTSWKKQAVPLQAETIAYYTSLVLDANDNPSMSFYEYDGPRGSPFRVRMRVVMWNGKYWQVSTVDGDNQSGKFNAMAADAAGHLHLAYANVNPGAANMRYGFWDGMSWHTEEVDGMAQNNLGYVGQAACIVLDQAGNPHLSYMNNTNATVKYAVSENSRWTTEVVDQLVGVGYPDRNSIALDAEERPYIGYYDVGLGSLKLAHREGKTWVAETIDSNESGFTSSLAIDQGTVWISYADEASGGVKVARASLADVRGTYVSQVGRKADSKETAQQRH